MLTPTETLLTRPQIQNTGKCTAQKCRLEANLKVQFQANGQP